MSVKRFVLRWMVMPIRLRTALYFCGDRLAQVTRWLFISREHTNLTYNLTDLNQQYLAHFLSIVCNQPAKIMEGYLREALDDVQLRSHIITCTRESKRNYLADDVPRYARRIGWYAIVRATRPAVVVETGIDKGLGSCLLTAALMRNRNEGYPGTYFGTDINPRAGYLLQAPYDQFGKILYGDSIESLKKLDATIDLFINDSDHSVDYEMREFETVAPKLSPKGIVIGDNAHFSDRLLNFAQETNRDFLYFHEQPKDHWYPGAGIGVAYTRERNSSQGAD
jgi:predicted O-methyltransferase YrrM